MNKYDKYDKIIIVIWSIYMLGVVATLLFGIEPATPQLQ